MTEIEKMFENAGIKPIDYKLEPMRTLKFSVDDIGNTWTREQYIKEVPIYPPFTAEKQLEIENVILQNKKNYNKWIEYNINVYGEWVMRFVRTDKFAPYIALGKTRAEAFANVINYFWQDLTDQEKEEIKEILNE